jgi:hypothetical protein
MGVGNNQSCFRTEIPPYGVVRMLDFNITSHNFNITSHNFNITSHNNDNVSLGKGSIVAAKSG